MMNRLCEDLLPDAGLTEQQHGRRRWRDLLNLRESVLKRRGLRDDEFRPMQESDGWTALDLLG